MNVEELSVENPLAKTSTSTKHVDNNYNDLHINNGLEPLVGLGAIILIVGLGYAVKRTYDKIINKIDKGMSYFINSSSPWK